MLGVKRCEVTASKRPAVSVPRASSRARDHAERMGEDLRALTAEREDLRSRLRDVDAQVGAVTGEVAAATRVVEETSEEESAAAEAVEAARARVDDLRTR